MFDAPKIGLEAFSSINQDLKDNIKKLYPDSKILKNYIDKIFKNLQSLNKGYNAFTYMTGIIPIAKKSEVFVKIINKSITYEKLENWYNGYKGPNGEKIFNTWSICQALNEILELIRDKKLSQKEQKF
ncbi:hypothetical protein BCR32DRAFT_281560 [Anaeromyces robustus]|uniref:Uncharacterized protein n=1 Tax=Anaeromyces robustus TaxID=1754192 RepID=A0A1Y1V6X3_9FUNG|nr:hypothetical protein BCR32DRAFT_288201 [Anaeromyces robustus]ORX79273.1 hypothetical protein BCR32DRAFT_281560 [Anaeromyces robustus]|eukprot:ORX48471.1 hypothetical protein BCR32DRAFT_288201 [Anaeromyces robustus]